MLQLRPYQLKGKTDILKEWEQHNILFYVLGTGGGKTVIFVDVIRELLYSGKRVMLIAHTEELIDQSWLTLYDNRIMAGIIQAQRKTDYSLPCQVCSIQTIIRRKDLPPADYIIIDEGHHAQPDNGYGKILSRYPFAKILCVSATPYRLSGEGFTNIAPGHNTHLIVGGDVRWLIKNSWLVPLRLFVKYIPDMSEAHIGANGDWKDDDAADAMQLAPIVDSYLQNAAGKSGITFACNVRHSKSMAAQYNAAGIPTAHLDANTPDNDYKDEVTGLILPGRKRIISDFKAQLIKQVCNVGIFTEGTDFPNCEVVTLGKPTQSLKTYLQMVGRVTRPLANILRHDMTLQERIDAIAASGKPHGIVLDCAGLISTHLPPDFPHNWQNYFEGGWKGKKKEKKTEEEMEMLVFIAEDGQGRRQRFSKVEEIIGLELIEVTKEVRRKIINIKSIKEFDSIYAKLKNKDVPYCGKVTVKQFKSYCDKYRLLMVPEIWDFIHRRLVLEIQQKKDDIVYNKMHHPDMYPDKIYYATLQRLTSYGVEEQWLYNQRALYYKNNEHQIREYMLKHKN